MKFFARTDVGQVREHNEDNFLVADLSRRSRGLLEANRATAIGPHGALFVVCDGMGGAAAGEIASQLAVDIIYERMVEGVSDLAPTRDEVARRLVRAVEAAGLRIFHEAKVDRALRGMGTTVTATAVLGEMLFFAQVGDSRGYILRGDTLVQLTRDQSLVNQLIEAGQLTEEEAETFEHNNIILQALGTSDTVQVDLTCAELRKGDILMLCSDGLSGLVRFEEIRDALRAKTEPLDICKSLVDRANHSGGYDNITVIIVEFDGESLQPFDPNAERLKYTKYILDNAANFVTAPVLPAYSPAAYGGPAYGEGAPYPPDAAPDISPDIFYAPAGADYAPASANYAPAGADGIPEEAPPTWAQNLPDSYEEFEDEGPIDIPIPNTRVPVWLVVAIVLGVIVVFAGAAFLLLR